jgi:predicted SnoaL-like aldol condensation-catalyzing enzyme
MRLQSLLCAAGAASLVLAAALPAAAQHSLADPVVAAPNPESLFHSTDPKLDRNKQAALHIEKDLLESHRWNEADKWLTQKYLQHNPQAASGLPGVVKFFTTVLKQQPLPIQNPTKVEIVAVQAEGDYVTVSTVRRLKDSTGQDYTTTWFDMWRFVDGKADEHWDPASLPSAPAK